MNYAVITKDEFIPILAQSLLVLVSRLTGIWEGQHLVL